MKRFVLPVIFLALFATCAQAGRNAQGSLIVHTADEVIYTPDWHYCDTPGVPTRCEDANPNGTHGLDWPQLVWLLAAFPYSDSPAVTAIQFGIDHNLPAGQGYFATYAPCGPSPLELPDAGWPDAGFGNLIAYGSPVYDHVFRFYFFTMYIDGPDSFIATRSYPSTGEAKFVDDSGPPIEDLCVNFGMMRWNGTGWNQCWMEGQGGACCYCDGTCLILLPQECEDSGGSSMGDDTTCEPNPCPMFLGACCYPDGTCLISQCASCPGEGGVWQGNGTVCDPNPCEDNRTGACCLDMNGNCVILRQADCYIQGGDFQGPDVPCDPNPCYGFPIERVTWGQIKATYR